MSSCKRTIQVQNTAETMMFRRIAGISFDLDDTLYDFSIPARTAHQAVPAEMSARTGVEEDRLRGVFDIATRSGNNHFVDGLASHSYRAQRFFRVLDYLGHADQVDMQVLLDLYETSFVKSIRPTPCALRLVRACRHQFDVVCVTSEGPHDAQLRTLAALGIDVAVDHVITSNREKRSKADGLFEVLPHRTGLPPAQILHIGDSLEQDVLPARTAGLKAAWTLKPGSTSAGESECALTLCFVRDASPDRVRAAVVRPHQAGYRS